MKKVADKDTKRASTPCGFAKQLLRHRKRTQKAKNRSLESMKDEKRKEIVDWDLQTFDLMEPKKKSELSTDDVSSGSDVDCHDLFCGDHGDRERYKLKYVELFCFAICSRFSFAYIFAQVEMMNYFGPILSFFLSAVLIVCTCIPVVRAFIFLGSYTNRYFIKIWEFVPILKGVSYSIALYVLPIQVYNIDFCATAILYFSLFLHERKIPWTDCDFKGASVDCIRLMGTNNTIDTRCCNDALANCSLATNGHLAPKYSTFDFWMMIRNINQEGKTHRVHFLTGKVLSLIFAYLTLFIFVVVGMKRYRHILRRVVFYTSILMVPIIILTVVYGPDISSPLENVNNYDSLFTYEFWSAVVIQTTAREVPMEMVNFGAQSPVSTTQTVAVILLYVTMEIIVLLLTLWMCISYQKTKQNYKIQDYRCLFFQGPILLFVLIPDMLSRWFLAYQVLLIYFALLFVWGISAVIVKCTAFVDAITGQFPKLRAYRTAVTGVLCMVLICYNVYLGFGGALEANYKKTTTQTPFISCTLSFTVCLGLFLYTPERIGVDYQFVHGVRLSNYFIYGMKMFMCASTMMFILTFILPREEHPNHWVRIFVLAPIPLEMLYVTSQYFSGFRETVFESVPTWGPKSAAMRMKRTWFDPTHHFVLDTSFLVCKHKCLRNSSNLHQQVLRWRHKLLGEKIGKEIKQRIDTDE